METSILESIKKMLGVFDEEEAFDTELIAHINTAIGTLRQLGVSDEKAFRSPAEQGTTFKKE